eukprot:s629_g22.t1
MWRYFMGRNPRSDEFQFHWSRMDTARAGRISQRALAKWLAKTAPKAFTTLAPPVIEPEGSETEDPGSGSLQATRTKSKIFRPAPGLWHQPSTPWQSAHEWNSVPQDPCDQNIAWRGCQPMGPVKFDDIPKTSNEVLNDDYQQGYLFKAKQKTSWHGSVVTTAVDILPGQDKAPMTPAKITWRLPAPLGCPFVVIDKLEVDKKGGVKLEGSTEKALKGLRIELKPELSDVMKTKTGLIYSGLKDARLALDLKGIGVQDAVAEATFQSCTASQGKITQSMVHLPRSGPATLGAKIAAPWCPDFGLRVLHGPFFASLLAKENYTASCHYKAADNLRLAANYTYGGKKTDGNYTIGLMYACNKNTTMKVKLDHNRAISCSVKQVFAKGFSALGGVKYDSKTGTPTYGLQISDVRTLLNCESYVPRSLPRCNAQKMRTDWIRLEQNSFLGAKFEGMQKVPTHSFATLRMLLLDDPRAFRPTALTDVRIGFSLQAQKKSNEDYCLMLCRLVQRCGSGAKQSTNLTRQRHLCQCGGRSRFSTWSDGQRLRPPESGSTLKAAVGTSLVAYLGYKGYRLLSSRWDRVEDVELPAVPEPSGHFVHPYEIWPWYQKAWFAFKRSVFLAWVFAPFMCASTLLVVFGKESRTWREYWLHQMLECTQRAGAAFQKFGQWLSMRPDMFPPDVILVLSKLRADAPAHSGVVSRRMLKDQLGKDVDELFEEFQEEPVASGSVGQVHRARLRAEHALDGPGGQLRDVAVKIQHPGVIDSAFMDLNIVWKIVEFSEKFLHMTMPFDRSDFDEVIQAQMDFTREAFNLQRFARNFKGEHRIRFPKVSSRFVTPEVLVETWENGEIISNIMEDFDNAKAACQDAMTALETKKREVQGDLSKILYDMSMKMMIRDNFVHGDLHGGNILYSTNDDHVTVLDAGIATSLDKRTVAPFGRFLHALCSGQTEKVVEYLQRFNESDMVVNTKQLHADIQETMDKYMGPFRIDKEGPLNAADMFGEVMFTLQTHGMPEDLLFQTRIIAGVAEAPARWSLLLLLLSVLANKVAGQVADEADVDEDEEDDEDFPESVKTLTDSTFQDFIKSNERVLVEFYAPWCGHCQQLEPQYNQAADALRMEGAKTMLAKVDATAETGLAEQYQVQSYPTLKYFVGGGDPVDYDGPREAVGIAEWLRKREKPAVEEMKESEVNAWIQKTLDENAFALVAHVKKKSARAKAYAKSAESLIDYKGSKLRFAVVWLPKTADPKKDAHLSMSRPLKDPEAKKLDFAGSWTDTGLAKWIKQSTYALVDASFAASKYSTEAMQEIGTKGAVVGIFDTEDAGKDMRSLLQKVAAAERSWRFATSPQSKLDESDLAVLGAKKDAPMQISVLYQEKKYVLKDVTEQAIKSFLADVLAKKAKPYYKSAPPPSQAAEGGVTVLTGDTFDEVVLNAKHDGGFAWGSIWKIVELSWQVEFYAPWCGHCKKLEPVWTQLAQKVESLGHGKQVVVAKMDATENECEEQVTGYPTLVFYPAVKKEKKFRQKLIYQGARDFDPLLDFLVENAVNLEGVELTEGVGKQASLVDRERARKKKKEL